MREEGTAPHGQMRYTLEGPLTRGTLNSEPKVRALQAGNAVEKDRTQVHDFDSGKQFRWLISASTAFTSWMLLLRWPSRCGQHRQFPVELSSSYSRRYRCPGGAGRDS